MEIAFSAFTLLAECQEEHPACKKWVMRSWCGYLSGARCKEFVYGPSDATATPSPRASLKSRLVMAYPGSHGKEDEPGKEDVKQASVCR